MVTKRKTLFIVCMAIIMCMLPGCGSNRMYASGKDGYTTITFVDGIQFDIVSSVCRNATAITNMSADMNYDMTQTYLYKDGEEAYFIFNMSSLVCIAQKGTSFHFSEAADMKEALENNGNILGVWFDCPKRKAKSRDESKNGVYKCIIDANAQVSLAPDIYNDFTGELATIEYNGTEWALFIGTIEGESFDQLEKDMQKTIGYMIQSMTVYEKSEEVPEEQPAVSLGGINENVSKESTVSENTVQKQETVTKDVSDNTVDDTDENNTESEQNEEEIVSETDKIEKIEVNIDEPVDLENVTTETEDKSDVEPEKITTMSDETTTPLSSIAVEKTAAPSPSDIPDTTATLEADVRTDTTQKAVRPAQNSYISQNNQKKIVYQDNTVYDTDIYSMLQPGKKARIFTLGNNGEDIVQVTEILTEQDAIKIIQSYCADGTLAYDYFDAPDGTSWHMAHYKLENASGYVDVKLRGLDGENLRLRGIEYSQRTYDIPVSDKEFYSFYAVPNGCKEYALEIGEGTIENTLQSGYYHITF